jgi:hypothetical protein
VRGADDGTSVGIIGQTNVLMDIRHMLRSGIHGELSRIERDDKVEWTITFMYSIISSHTSTQAGEAEVGHRRYQHLLGWGSMKTVHIGSLA